MNDVADMRAATQALKQAVVLVHGMGDQVPMGTLRGFVETMWVQNPNIVARESDDPAKSNPVWWKPDPRTGSYELSRVTTRVGYGAGTESEGPRTDFYEFYWADLTVTNTIAQFRDWFMSLLWRWPRQVPLNVMSVWIILWTLTLIFGGLALWGAIFKAFGVVPMPHWATLLLAASGLVYAAAHSIILNTFGDVARYVRAKPSNIAARQAIRDRGLTLLRQISDSGSYQRIILVGHSLGTIIAYDLLKLLWSERGEARVMTEGDALYEACLACEAAGDALREDDVAALEVYQASQRSVFDAMQGRGGPKGTWIISDFVTLGSPLAHAQFLLERDADRLKRGEQERRFPVNPPLSEGPDGFLYQPERLTKPQAWSAHHAAPFAAVRWTNIYDPTSYIIFGDLISGPVQGNFGFGIKDIRVKIRRVRSFFPERFFTHTLYWADTGEGSPHLKVLREALRLTSR